MPENTGLHKKYEVRRLDGKESKGPFFVLDIGSDPVNAMEALRAYSDSCCGPLPELAKALDALVYEIQMRNPGPMHQALHTPREEAKDGK